MQENAKIKTFSGKGPFLDPTSLLRA